MSVVTDTPAAAVFSNRVALRLRASIGPRLAAATKLLSKVPGGDKWVQAAQDSAATLAASATFARNTGFVWQLSGSGAQALFEMWRSGAQNPASAYRIASKMHPHKAALVHIAANGERELWTFAQLDAAIDQCALSLVESGVGPGRPVLLCMQNCPTFLIASAAAARAGSSAVAVSYRSTARELGFLLGHAKPALVLTDGEPQLLEQATALAELPAALAPQIQHVGSAAFQNRLRQPLSSALRAKLEKRTQAGGAHVVYTSGTTGKPKAAVRKFPKNSMLSAFRVINRTPLHVADVHLVACPLYHSTAFAFAILAHVMGNTVITLAEFSPEQFFAVVAKEGVTTTAVVPTMLQRLIAYAEALPTAARSAVPASSLPSAISLGAGLRVVFSGGAALPPSVANAFMNRFGDVLWNFYGATETGIVSLASPAQLRAHPGTIGTPIEGVEIRLLDAARRAVASGAAGELYVKSNMVVEGYQGDAAATAASLDAGYFGVGDIAQFGAAGELYLVGRAKELIISGGVNVYPAEVEAALLEHPALEAACVFGVADAKWGERVFAVVVKRAGARVTAADLRAFAKLQMAGPKCPQQFEFVKELPKSATGKMNKKLLAAEFAQVD